jgi:hypothetical protein
LNPPGGFIKSRTWKPLTPEITVSLALGVPIRGPDLGGRVVPRDTPSPTRPRFKIEPALVPGHNVVKIVRLESP